MRPGGLSAIVSTGPRSSGPRPGRVGDFGPDEPRGSDACFSVVPLKDPHRAGCADDFGHPVQSTSETDSHPDRSQDSRVAYTPPALIRGEGSPNATASSRRIPRAIQSRRSTKTPGRRTAVDLDHPVGGSPKSRSDAPARPARVQTGSVASGLKLNLNGRKVRTHGVHAFRLQL